MNKRQKSVLAVGTMVLILLIVYPPYFAIGRESDGKLHAFVGYHWVWNPPVSCFLRLKIARPRSMNIPGFCILP